MATNTGFAAHETLNVHEALRACGVELTKMEFMQTMVQDSDLKRFLDQQITDKKKGLQELENWAQKIIS